MIILFVCLYVETDHTEQEIFRRLRTMNPSVCNEQEENME